MNRLKTNYMNTNNHLKIIRFPQIGAERNSNYSDCFYRD